MLRIFYIITVVLFLFIFFIWTIIKVSNGSQESVKKIENKPKPVQWDDLKQNLRNLGGRWSFYNKKTKSEYILSVCFTNSTLTGTYQIYTKKDDWGTGIKHDFELSSSGDMKIIEGYDEFMGKAYVGNDLKTGNDVFLLATEDRLLRLKQIEADMFGEHMIKISNECK